MQTQTSINETTFWEDMARTRWGRYLSEIEQATIECAAGQFSKPGSALEVGCEGGRWSRLLASRGWKMTCTDVEAERLAICQRRVPDARCILADSNEPRFPVEDNICDLFLSIEVPVSEEPWFAAELIRVLRPGGIAVCTFHNRNSYRGRLVNLVRGTDRFYKMDYASCRRSLVEKGFLILAERGFSWFPFSRGSNSPMVPIASRLERLVGLPRLVRYSPWVAVIAQKPL